MARQRAQPAARWWLYDRCTACGAQPALPCQSRLAAGLRENRYPHRRRTRIWERHTQQGRT